MYVREYLNDKTISNPPLRLNMGEKTPEQRWIQTVVMAGLNRLRENMEGEKLETFADLYAEHDRVMALIE